MVKVVFSNKKITKTFKIESNKTILDLSRIENIAIEGSCSGSMSCSTCHVIIHDDWIAKLPLPCIDEKEMLSLLPNYTKNSRLGCQIVITDKLEGLQFSLPKGN